MTQGTPDHNLSTEHQKEGDALKPSDTLDRDQAGSAATKGADDRDDRAASRTGEDDADRD